MKAVTRSSIVALFLAIIYKIGPGDVYWMSKSDLEERIREHPLPSIGDSSLTYSLHRFKGGDNKNKLTGRLYLPLTTAANESTNSSSSSPPPIILLAHGLGLTQDSKLEAYLQAFTQAGFAAFTFDYASFGWSEGWPRHQVIPNNHIRDVRAALAYIQGSLPPYEVDATKVGLWGSSYGGGHVLSLAADESLYLNNRFHNNGLRFSHVKAVVAQVPHVRLGLIGVVNTILRDPGPGITALLRIGAALIKGAISYIITGEMTYIPLSGLPGSSAMMQNPGDLEGYGKLNVRVDSSWQNKASITSVLAGLQYNPYATIDKVDIPSLLVAAENDTLCPAKDSEAAVSAMNQRELPEGDLAKLLKIPDIGHFDIYDGKELDEILVATVDFYKSTLR